MKILVTGGAGYIGSFMVRSLIGRGYEVSVLDNLKRGHKDVLDGKVDFIESDITDLASIKRIFSNDKFDAVIHFAGLISVEESTREPEMYYENNVVGSKNLFETAIQNGTNNFIFSSSAAVYGNPNVVPIPENHAKNPTSEYGKNKLEVERILESIRENNSEVSFTCLRYFNAAGAALDGSCGESHMPESHIIPLAIKAAMAGSEFNLYGTDYQTQDGTCIRDYIHVLDLVEAHILALESFENKAGGFYYNVGTGSGYSNREVVEMIQRLSGKNIKINEKPRRVGDPAQLIADPSKINSELGFFPKYSDLETIIESAWVWHSKNQK